MFSNIGYALTLLLQIQEGGPEIEYFNYLTQNSVAPIYFCSSLQPGKYMGLKYGLCHRDQPSLLGCVLHHYFMIKKTNKNWLSYTSNPESYVNKLKTYQLINVCLFIVRLTIKAFIYCDISKYSTALRYESICVKLENQAFEMAEINFALSSKLLSFNAIVIQADTVQTQFFSSCMTLP